MKQFNLDAALDDKDRVVFRSKKATIEEIIYLENVSSEEQPILVIDSNGRVSRHCIDGSWTQDTNYVSPMDLMLSEQAHIRWVNVYKDKYGQVKVGNTYMKEYEARRLANNTDNYIETVSIEWVE